MLNRKNGGGSSMISTGIVGTPFQSYSPKSASWILVNTLAFAGPPMARMRSRAAAMAGSSMRHAGHLHREVALDGRRQVGGAALEEAPAAVGVLAAAEVADGPLLAVAVDAVDEVAEQQVLGGDRRVRPRARRPSARRAPGSRGDSPARERWRPERPSRAQMVTCTLDSGPSLDMDLLLGTFILRPYVFGFLAAFLLAGAVDLGWRRTLAVRRPGSARWRWLAEFSSTRIGIPFGLYHYTGTTRGQELFIADVPLMDCLSFTFLAYAAFCLARAGAAPPAGVAGDAGAGLGGADDAARRRHRPARGARRPLVPRTHLLLPARAACTSACRCRTSRAG